MSYILQGRNSRIFFFFFFSSFLIIQPKKLWLLPCGDGPEEQMGLILLQTRPGPTVMSNMSKEQVQPRSAPLSHWHKNFPLKLFFGFCCTLGPQQYDSCVIVSLGWGVYMWVPFSYFYFSSRQPIISFVLCMILVSLIEANQKVSTQKPWTQKFGYVWRRY